MIDDVVRNDYKTVVHDNNGDYYEDVADDNDGNQLINKIPKETDYARH